MSTTKNIMVKDARTKRILLIRLTNICRFSLIPLPGSLTGSSSVEFSGGIASFLDLAIDHEGNNYILIIKAFTIPSSRYQFSTNTTPFDVKERILELVITQQPGKCRIYDSNSFQLQTNFY